MFGIFFVCVGTTRVPIVDKTERSSTNRTGRQLDDGTALQNGIVFDDR